MSYQLHHELKTDYLFVKVSGPRTFDNVIAISKEIIKLSIKYDASAVLLEISELEGRLSLLNSWSLVTEDLEYIRKLNIPIKKLALVDTNKYQEGYDFFETIAYNRGYLLKVFENINLAIDWICQDKNIQ